MATYPVIPAEAVEAAAKTCLECAEGYKWADFPEEDRAGIRDFILPLLEAAAPHIRAQAWEEGYTLGYADCANKQESNRPNPYMLNNEGEK